MAEEFTIFAAHRLSGNTTQIVDVTAQHGQNGKIAIKATRALEAKKDTPKFWRGTLGIDDFANIAGLPKHLTHKPISMPIFKPPRMA